MKKYNVFDIKGTDFPAGRNTKVIVGPGAPVEAEGFVMGYVTIYPGGSVPLHSHEQEEVYLILKGNGEIRIKDKSLSVKKGDYVYISPHQEHHLMNNGKEDLVMIFCYAPKGVVEHWNQEKHGHLKHKEAMQCCQE
ncbi:MAG: hypothetical protein PWQ82_709 [Thermosediminibacterales bacterium]|nr:hypothetical protein [Thermosediminibacterales bacterium]MDK2836637.1 hypothetical protein [Thermosediminibacterales bacterium]